MNTRPRPVKYRKKNKKAKIPKPAGDPGFKLEPHQVLLRPLVTEKGTHQSTRYNAYTFKVNPASTKIDVKAAVQALFNVRVTGVSTQIRHGKNRRFKATMGRQQDWKKAVVTLHTDDKIEFF